MRTQYPQSRHAWGAADGGGPVDLVPWRTNFTNHERITPESARGRRGDRIAVHAHTFTLIVNHGEPRASSDQATVVLAIDGDPVCTGVLPARQVTV